MDGKEWMIFTMESTTLSVY